MSRARWIALPAVVLAAAYGGWRLLDSSRDPEVQAAVLTLLDRRLRAQRVDVGDVEVRRLLAATYSRRSARREIASTLDSLRLARAGELPNTEFTDERVAVEEWVEADGDGDRAAAELVGSQSLWWRGRWHVHRYRWWLELVGEGGGWRIDRLTFDDLDT